MSLIELFSNPWIWAAIILLLFAGLDLMVWVANDAVNFLTSALGSKVAPKRVIFTVAALGILIGATFSGGMMEIARKGIFNPDFFTFYDIIIVFFSVMLVNIILLDIFNTLKLPTSTTVAIVFQLLWAGLAIALIHLVTEDLTISQLSHFINWSSTLTIIIGIFLSVAVAFSTGWLVQMIVRALVSFEYEKTISRRWWLFGGLSLTVMIYFLIIKGLKEVSRIPDTFFIWVENNILLTRWGLMIITSLFSLLYQKVFKRGILQFIILFGTFSLAAAFAGNDLVNFIGVPVAGFQAIMFHITTWWALDQLMTAMSEPIATPQIFLIGSAIIMIITLFTSKKAQAVADTAISLTKHATWQERFTPWRFSRWLVKETIIIRKKVIQLLPKSRQKKLAYRFEHKKSWSDAAAFDLIRASTNLTLSAVLIAIATSFKLPLSTTYVTFMVAMGAALADGAWWRDSAVYRISGVVTIVGSWIMTAIISLIASLLLTLLLWKLGFWAVGITTVIVGYLLYRSYFVRKEVTRNAELSEILASSGDLYEILYYQVIDIFPQLSKFLNNTVVFLFKEEDKQLAKLDKKVQAQGAKTKYFKRNIYKLFRSLPDEAVTKWQTYVQWIEVFRRAVLALATSVGDAKNYVLNNHPEFIKEQRQELTLFANHVGEWLDRAFIILEDQHYILNDIDYSAEALLQELENMRILQFWRIKAWKTGVRNTTLYDSILDESEVFIYNIQKLLHYLRRMQ